MSNIQRWMECVVGFALLALLMGNVSAVHAQCESMWMPGSHIPGVHHASGARVNTVIPFDPDGPGPLPEVVALAGYFTWAGGAPAAGVVLWNRADGSWTPVGTELVGEVLALAAVPNAVGGFDLYAGLNQTTLSIVRWNGAAWVALPASGITTVWDLAVLPDSEGGHSLIACGSGSSSTIRGIARWDGTAWSAMGSGAISGTTVYDVEPVQRADGGWDVFAAGRFPIAPSGEAYGVARWNGVAWSSLGMTPQNTEGLVLSLASLPNGSGGYDLVAGGQFTRIANVPASNLARWNGTQWSHFGGAFGQRVQRLRTVNSAEGGRSLFVVGIFTSVAGVATRNLAKWNGAEWSSLSVGNVGPSNASIRDIVRVPGGGENDLLIGGFFETIDDAPARCVARREGSRWNTIARDGDLLASQPGIYVLPNVSGGSDLLVGRHWDRALRRWGPARWSGSEWELLGTGMSSVDHFAHHRDASGEIDVYALGSREQASGLREYFLAKLEGGVWSPLTEISSGISQRFDSLAIAPTSDGSLRLYVGGSFAQVGGVACRNIALWDGESWSPLGAGPQFGVVTIGLLPSGEGGFDPIVGGGWISSPTDPPNYVGYVYRFDGLQWVSMGPAFNRKVHSLLVAPNSDGTHSLYAGGYFTNFNGGVARWTGTGWTNLAEGLVTGIYNGVLTLAWVPDSLRGHHLLAGGNVSLMRTGPSSRIGRWDGVAWTAIDPSPAGVFRLVIQPGRGGTADIIADTNVWTFDVGGTPSAFVARYVTVCSCPADLDNDGDFGNGLTRDGAVTIDDLLSFLVGFEEGSVLVDLDNGTGTASGGGTPDNAVTIDDLLFFLVQFEAGC